MTTSMQNNVHERLNWLESVMKAISPNVRSHLSPLMVDHKADEEQEPETRDIGGRILDVLVQRLESEYMRIAESNSSNSVLRKIVALTKQTKDIRRSFP